MGDFSYGHGETTVYAKVHLMGEDLVVLIYGGTRPHIGASALGVPRPSLKDPDKISSSVSIITLTGHKDDHLARKAAQYLASALNRTVVAVAGFHIDDADDAQISQVVENCDQLLKVIADSLL